MSPDFQAAFFKSKSHFLSPPLFKSNPILSYKEKVFYKLIFISTFNAQNFENVMFRRANKSKRGYLYV